VNTEVQDTTETRKLITVTLTGEETQQEEQAIVKEFLKIAKIPGFRPGKAPQEMVKKRYHKEIAKELEQRLVGKAHESGVAKSDFEVFNVIDLDAQVTKAGEEAKITFTVDVLTEFELPTYKGLAIEPVDNAVSDEEVEQTIDRIRGQRAEFNEVEKAAAEGDYVRCSYEGKIDDKLISEIAPDAAIYGTQKMTWEEAGSKDAPGVRAVVDGLVGMSAGDEKTVEMDFPADFEVAALAGKKATYTVKAEEVRERILPELDDAFLESVKAESEESFRDQIKNDLVRQKENQGRSQQREAIAKQLLAAVDFPLPESGLESETQAVLRDYMQQNMQRGVPAEEFEKNKEALYEGAAKAAHDRLKNRIIMLKIADKEKIQVSNEDLSQMIMNEAMMTRVAPEKLVKELRKDQNRVQQMRREALLGKTMDFLYKEAVGGDAATKADWSVNSVC